MNLEELRKIQERMAKSVVLDDLIPLDDIKYVVGVDQAFIDDKIISCAVKLRLPELEVVDKSVKTEKVSFPYIPTFLMFREGEPAVNAVKDLVDERTAIMVDGSGIAHPRRCGLATYIALKLRKPTVGITKKRLFGEVVKLSEELAKIVDGEEVIGFALKTCKRCNPIYISPGSFISPESALKLVQECLKGYKLPEPVRIADKMTKEVKRELWHNLKA
ncbi:endonuclease V [Archaeoglobus sp.]|uniref:endonuclease V n=1 Tax=Archaeoglobus sp. TaxID=1872626 RepID=UPI0025C3D802|nr:endonuclease V [Archaeoglobus sp.]